MNTNENQYREEVFLSEYRNASNLNEERGWQEHQDMQLAFLDTVGFKSDTNFLDIGCGPMRLGVALIPKLINGWYFGQDINPETLNFGEEILRKAGISLNSQYTLLSSDQFDLEKVDREIDMAFSNSLFSHLNLNSILTCLYRVQEVLSPGASYYSTFFQIPTDFSWLEPYPRNKWGHDFFTYSYKDPYHYSFELIRSIANKSGFKISILKNYGHPTQTMIRFKSIKSRWF